MNMEQPLASSVQQLNINSESGFSRTIEREQESPRRQNNPNQQRRQRKVGNLIKKANFKVIDPRIGTTRAPVEELDYIPTAVVIKNIPFSVKRELLLDIFVSPAFVLH